MEEAKRKENEKRAAKYYALKSRRQTVASKSTHVASFVQRISVQTEAGYVRDELLRLYESCNRCNLRLWNEVSRPEVRDRVFNGSI